MSCLHIHALGPAPLRPSVGPQAATKRMVSLFDLLPFWIGAALAGVVWAMQPYPGTAWRWVVILAAALFGWAFGRLLMKGVAHVLAAKCARRSEEHTSELQSRQYLVCRL